MRRPNRFPNFTSLRSRCLRGIAMGGLWFWSGCCSSPTASTPAPREAKAEQKLPPAPAHLFGAFADVPTHNDRPADLLGHLRTRSVSEILHKVQTEYSPPEQSASFDEKNLRILVGTQLGRRSAIATRIALDQPITCLFFGPEHRGTTLACAFSYDGGIEQFQKDMGRRGLIEDQQTHVAVYDLGDDDWYVDTLGDAIVVSTQDDAFVRSKSYLQSLHERQKQLDYGQLEVAVYARQFYESYEQDLEQALEEIERVRRIPFPPPDETVIDRRLDAVEQQLTATQLRRFSKFDSFRIFLNAGPKYFRIGALSTPVSDEEEAIAPKALAKHHLDPKIANYLPDRAFAIFATAFDPATLTQSKEFQSQLELVSELLADLTQSDPEAMQKRIHADLTDLSDSYENQLAFALHRAPESPILGSLWVRLKKDRVEHARAAWKSWSERFDASSLLGPEGLEYVNWHFEPSAMTISGIEIDRWVLEAGPVIRRRLHRGRVPKARRHAESVVGELSLFIDRIQVGDKVLFVAHGKKAPAFLEAAIAKLKSDEPKPLAAFADVAAEHPGAHTLAALDGALLEQWWNEVATQLPDTEPISLPWGKSLGDVVFTAQSHADGRSGGQIALRPPVVRRASEFVKTE